MGRARLSPEDRVWLDAHPGEGLPPDMGYRPGSSGTQMRGPKDRGRSEPMLPIEEATLAAQGKQISQNRRHNRAMLIALAQIVAIGTGRDK